MAIYVNTNVSSLTGRNSLNNVQNNLTTTYQRLSTGMRINSAKDDAAGLQIADRLTTQINGLNQGNRNASDGIAFAQTAEGAMDEISSMLQKIRTLAVQASTGTNTEDDRKAIDKEAESLVSEIRRIASQTTYGGKKILDGGDTGAATMYTNNKQSAGQLTLQVGANSGDKVTFDVANFLFSRLGTAVNAGTLGGGKGYGTASGARLNLSTASGASDVITIMDAMIKFTDAQRADLGAIQNRLESSIRNQSNIATNESDARSRIRDADFAEESANLSQQSIIQQAAASMLMQANTRPQLALSLLG
ncbi:MAG TPA: flagellin [Candidatus Anaerobiospirillum pullistercoris]|uniref:Flagellin n=1 Tax=Candidatus Anaerobiospirillum pullistercoris TaxID=2838452 RepID=A0A9D1WC81_9GAMM|nr:flagellin [Candidatus Anaerobiospirillum pullistercoris]